VIVMLPPDPAAHIVKPDSIAIEDNSRPAP
jgi:hypothetical protein